MPVKKLTCPEEVEYISEEYFQMCDDQKRPYTMPGLAVALGFAGSSSLGKYRKAEGYEEYHDAMNHACLRVEAFTAEQLYNKGVNVAGPVFALKNMGYSDRPVGQEADVIVKVIAAAAKL